MVMVYKVNVRNVSYASYEIAENILLKQRKDTFHILDGCGILQAEK